MRKSIAIASLAAALVVASAAFAQAPAAAPAGAPAGATALCNDGSYTSAAIRRRACVAHKGIKEWYGRSSSGPATPKAPATAHAAPGAAHAAAPGAAADAAAPAASKHSAKPTSAAAGGPGTVWVNKTTKTYHCSTDKWYGKTKNGEYLSEAVAKSQGFHPADGKACQ